VEESVGSRIEEIDDVSSQLIQIFHFLITQFRFTFIDDIFIPFIFILISSERKRSRIDGDQVELVTAKQQEDPSSLSKESGG